MTILAAAVCLAAEAQQWDSLYYRPDRHVVPVEEITCRRGMELLGGDSLDVIETVAESKHAGIVYISITAMPRTSRARTCRPR